MSASWYHVMAGDRPGDVPLAYQVVAKAMSYHWIHRIHTVPLLTYYE